MSPQPNVIKAARRVLRDALRSDKVLRQAYLDNISIHIQDNTELSKAKADYLADRLLKVILEGFA